MSYFDIHSINVLKDRTSACITMNSCSICPNIFEYKQLPRLANERAPTKGNSKPEYCVCCSHVFTNAFLDILNKNTTNFVLEMHS